MADLVLSKALLANQAVVDVSIKNGIITAITPHTSHKYEAFSENTPHSSQIESIEGWLLLPAWSEPHAHLDKAYTADIIENPTGDLTGAIDAFATAWPKFEVEDITARAGAAFSDLVAMGTTKIRSHFDLTPDSGTKSQQALLQLKSQTDEICDLELVPLAFPLSGPDSGVVKKQLEQGLAKGVDLVGGCPHIEADPTAAMVYALEVAVEWEVDADLHFDETLDPTVANLPQLCREVERLGWGGRVTASHCVSHGMLPPAEQDQTAQMLADVGVRVVVNPRTNLFLGARGVRPAPPRGLAGTEALVAAGVGLAGGGDNLADPFCTVGSPDPLEAAFLLVLVAHLGVDQALEMIEDRLSNQQESPPGEIQVGQRANLVAIEAGSVREAISTRTPSRKVFYRGQKVAETSLGTWRRWKR